MTKSKAALAREVEEREEAIKNLREWLVNVEEITTVCVHVTSSGSQRVYKILVGAWGYKVHDISWAVAKAGIGTLNSKYNGVQSGAYGFDLVYAIGRTVIGNEAWMCRGEDARCGSNEHVNGPDPVVRDERIMHTGDGGYRFRHHQL